MGDQNAPERARVCRPGMAGKPNEVVEMVPAEAYDRMITARDEARAERDRWKQQSADRAMLTHEQRGYTVRYRVALAELVAVIDDLPLDLDVLTALREALPAAVTALAEGEQPAGEPPGWPDGMYETAAMALYRASNPQFGLLPWRDLAEPNRERYRLRARAVADDLTEHLRALIHPEPAAGEQSTTETATGEQVERVARAMRALRFPDADWDFDPATEPDPENWPIVDEEREHWREMARAALAAAPATPEGPDVADPPPLACGCPGDSYCMGHAATPEGPDVAD